MVQDNEESDPARGPEEQTLEPTLPDNNRAGTEDQDDSEEAARQSLPTVRDWLLERQLACRLSHDAIADQLTHYRDALDPDNEDRALQSRADNEAYHHLKALMLASCDPARTPGLLESFLNMANRVEDWPQDYIALFALLDADRQAYRLLEQQYEELKKQHRETIEGIGNIEKSLRPQEPEQQRDRADE